VYDRIIGLSSIVVQARALDVGRVASSAYPPRNQRMRASRHAAHLTHGHAFADLNLHVNATAHSHVDADSNPLADPDFYTHRREQV
jgi:hypothetical protein